MSALYSLRPELEFSSQTYQGRSFVVVKDPVTNRYLRFTEGQAAILELLHSPIDVDSLASAAADRLHTPVKRESLEGFLRSLDEKLLLENVETRDKLDHRDESTKQEKNLLYLRLFSLNPDRGLYLTFASLFVATVSVRLPKTTSVVISMGDVLTILALMHFGPGPALVTYWFQMVIGNVSDLYRKYGLSLTEEIYSYKFSFNFANCALSMWCMHLAFAFVETLGLSDTAFRLIGPAAIATTWFLTNTGTLSTVVALLGEVSVWGTWKDGLQLYVLNFYGSAAAAGLLSLFYKRNPLILLLALPIAAVFYQLYEF